MGKFNPSMMGRFFRADNPVRCIECTGSSVDQSAPLPSKNARLAEVRLRGNAALAANAANAERHGKPSARLFCTMGE